MIDGVLSGMRWNTAFVDYGDTDSATDYQSGYFSDVNGDGTSAQREGFSQLTAQQKVALHAALNGDVYSQLKGAVGFSVEGFTNLSIGYQGGGTGGATIRAANSGDPGTAYAYYPDNSIYGGDIFFGNTYDGTQFSLKEPIAGNYAWHTVIHEAGHALGLKHANEAGGPGGVAIPAQYNSIEYTVMTSSSFIGDTGGGYDYEAFGAPQTYMMLDILALQTMYGADFTVNGGNTVYTWDPETGQASVNGELAIDPGANRIFSTLWDGNGNDTYDLSNYRTAMRIDLRPGQSSTFSETQLAFLGGGPNGGFARGNVFNAFQFEGDPRSLIENANGGSNNDTMIGNATANVLRGNGGNDILDGGAGDDTLVGGIGWDTLRGGSGDDVASYLAATSGVRANLTNPSNNTGEAAGDTYSLIENLAGSSFQDVLYGNGSNNRLSGAAGNDTLVGHGGADTLIGGAGADTASYAGAATGVVARLGNPAANTGYAAGDTYSSIENLFGSANADGLYGNSGNNAINGGAGNDRIDGGNGTDLLTGGAGVDAFLFSAPLNATANIDKITDYSVASDTIELDHAIFAALGIGTLSAAAFQANSSGLAADFDRPHHLRNGCGRAVLRFQRQRQRRPHAVRRPGCRSGADAPGFSGRLTRSAVASRRWPVASHPTKKAALIGRPFLYSACVRSYSALSSAAFFLAGAFFFGAASSPSAASAFGGSLLLRAAFLPSDLPSSASSSASSSSLETVLSVTATCVEQVVDDLFLEDRRAQRGG